MSTIVTRAGKGSPLTHTEVDNNFTNLNTDKAEDSTVVKLTGDQTIGGTKTFSSTITGSISGNAGTATNGVVTTGSYADPSWITSLDDGKVLPSMSGNSGKFLSTDGTNSSWATVDALPSQTGNSGKYLTTDGTTPSWDALATVANSGSYNDLSDKPTIPTNLDSLTDVTISSPSTDQVLKYNGTVWVNAAASGSVTPSSVSDQSNTSTGYFDLPSGTTAQRPASPATGMIRFNTSNIEYEVYNGSDWFALTTKATGYSIEYLVIAGGGSGGGYFGGGGGAGGLIAGSTIVSSTTALTVTIGAGGVSKANGSNSSFGSLATAIGGGQGAVGGGGGGTGSSSGGSGGGGAG
jgi:hypothetical protein